MRTTARYRRLLTALSLVQASVLMLVSVVLQPSIADPAGSLAAMSEAGPAPPFPRSRSPTRSCRSWSRCSVSPS